MESPLVVIAVEITSAWISSFERPPDSSATVAMYDRITRELGRKNREVARHAADITIAWLNGSPLKNPEYEPVAKYFSDIYTAIESD